METSLCALLRLFLMFFNSCLFCSSWFCSLVTSCNNTYDSATPICVDLSLTSCSWAFSAFVCRLVLSSVRTLFCNTRSGVRKGDDLAQAANTKSPSRSAENPSSSFIFSDTFFGVDGWFFISNTMIVTHSVSEKH